MSAAVNFFPSDLKKGHKLEERTSESLGYPKTTIMRHLSSHLEHRHLLGPCSCANFGDRCFSNCSGWYVYNSLEIYIRLRIDQESQVGNCILNFFAVVKAHSAINSWNVANFSECVFQRPRLSIGAVENRHLAGVGSKVFDMPLDRFGNHLRFFALT